MERGSTGLAGGGQVGGEPPVISLRTLRVKMVLVGSSGVGKSSLTLRFSKNEFKCTSPTVGCEYPGCSFKGSFDFSFDFVSFQCG